MKTVYVNMEVSEKASQPAVCRAAVPATARVKLSALNPHLICVLCGGYYIDATTIIECLHSFCRTCIIRYLATSKYCPVCEVQVHKTRPLHHIRQDKTLQDLVYKLVPGLFKEEMKRRRDYYKSQADDGGPSTSRHGGGEERGEAGGYYDRVIYTEDEKISLSLELRLNGRPPRDFRKRKVNGEVRMKSYRLMEAESCDRRFLLCPAAVTIAHLKKFIRMKFSLSERYNIDVFHTDENLSDLYTLMDIAYIYSWRRRGPLRLFYTVYEFPAKKRRLNSTDTDVSKETSKEEEEVAPPVSPPVVNGDANSINNNDNNNDNNNNDDNSNNDNNNNNDEGPIDLVKKSPENVQKTEPPPVVEPQTNGEVSDIVRTPSPLSNEKPSNINSVTQSPPRENLSPKTEAPSLSVNSAEPTSSSQTEAVSESLTKTSVVPPPPVEESVEENKPINMVMTAAVKKEPVEIEDTTGQT